MIAFVALAALMVATALAFALRAQQRRTAWALAISIPAAAVSVYAAVVNASARDPLAALSEHVKRHPDDVGALTDLAVMLAMNTTQHLAGEPERLIERALVLDPNNVQALALSGSVRFERKDYAGAIALWRRVITQAPEESAITQSIAASIAKAQALAGDDTSPLNNGRRP